MNFLGLFDRPLAELAADNEVLRGLDLVGDLLGFRATLFDIFPLGLFGRPLTFFPKLGTSIDFLIPPTLACRPLTVSPLSSFKLSLLGLDGVFLLGLSVQASGAFGAGTFAAPFALRPRVCTDFVTLSPAEGFGIVGLGIASFLGRPLGLGDAVVIDAAEVGVADFVAFGDTVRVTRAVVFVVPFFGEVFLIGLSVFFAGDAFFFSTSVPTD